MAGEQITTAVNSDAAAPDTDPAVGGEWPATPASLDQMQPDDVARFGAAFVPLSARRGWLGPAVAGLALAGWTAYFGWANADVIASNPVPSVWAGWISSWATPALLIGLLWLIVMRSSRRETRHFAGAAQLLATEAERLERRLLTINRELSLAREFVAAQARDLDSVGRIAVDRLSQHAERLQLLVRENSTQIEAIGAVSAAALANMDGLRGQLPVLTSAAKDLTNNLGNAGSAANARLEELNAGFNRLVQSGEISEKLVEALRGQFDQAIDGFAARIAELEQTIAVRVQAMRGQAEHFRVTMLDQQAEFDAQLRARTTALTGEIGETRDRLDREEAESITSLRSRLAALRDETSAIARAQRDGENAALAHWREAVAQLDADLRGANEIATEMGRQSDATSHARMAKLAAEAATLTSHGDAATAQFDAIGRSITQIAVSSDAAEAAMTHRLNLMSQRLGDSRGLLDATDHTLLRLTDTSATLLDQIKHAATHSREDLAQAIATGVAKLGDLEERALTMREMVIDADRSGASLSAHLQTTQNRLGEATVAMAAWHDDINAKAGSHAHTLNALNLAVAQLDKQTIAAAARAQGELIVAIRALDEAAGAALARIEQRGAASISTLAEQLGAESGDSIERAMRLQVTEIAGKLEQAAAHAAGISREAAAQLREQLAKVSDLVGNLETRVDHARARAEERVDDDFARRVALITEALNSNAIDIAKALDTDVSDTAWSAYLRGDRGIFTRRAVRLLDPPEARDILQLYQADRYFRESVSHYIHDFEGMLRQLLSTRDGHAMGVTMLSSDMGKLYVALAQAIERLRN